MSKQTIRRLSEMLERSMRERDRHKREHPNATAVRGQMRRDEDALREAIKIISGGDV